MQGLVEFARESLGIDFWPGQAEILRGWASTSQRKALMSLGRRSGKTLMAAVAAIHNATIADYSAYLRPGEERFIVFVATRQDQARELVRFVRELLADAPDHDLRQLVDERGSTMDEVRFRTGVTIRAMPCSSRSTRGLPISLLVLDEAAFMNTTDDGPAAGREVYRALLPSTAQFQKQGYVMVLSTPYWCTGIFWDLFNAGLTGADDIFVSQRATWEVNPTITRESLDAEFRADPDYARREFGAEFIEGAGAFLNAVSVRDCVATGRTELPPIPGKAYVAAADPAFAAGGDRFTFAIGHEEHNGDHPVYVLDCLRAWQGKRSPLNSDTVLDEIADLARRYGISDVISDQYAVVPLSDGLHRRNVNLIAQPLTNELKADIFTSAKRAINNGEVELLDNDQLVAEFINLEIRPTSSGKSRIHAGSHFKDDLAMSVATVIHSMSKAERGGWVMAFGDDWSSITNDNGTTTWGDPMDELQWTPMR